MRILKIYQNFYLRNLILLVFFIILLFCSLYIDFPDKNPKTTDDDNPLDLLWGLSNGFIPIYFFSVFSNTVLVKKLFLNRRYLLFFPVFILYWILCHIALNAYFELLEFGEHRAFISLLVIGNGAGMYFLHLWILKNIRKGTNDMINMASELSFLKQQLNPHFLLNAMNNLYGESLSAPDIVPERILNLSDMLRYQIEATKRHEVSLDEEIAFVRQYVAYYKFSNDRLGVKEVYSGNVDDIKLPPLFFLPLVENAVKFSGEAAAPRIAINLNVTGKDLTFTIENTFLVSGSRAEGTGIGIENLRRRLEVYGLRHELTCGKKRDIYKIKLKIWGLSTAALL